ncbi:MAG: nicotinate-nucleotide--dimethylbenzimidazole phosphoribosyltransferase [Phascolarctobacterium sp.]
MHIEEIVQKIVPVDQNCIKLAQARFDALIKPVGSLAKLEQMTSRYAGIICAYDKHEIDYPKRELLVWCDIKDADKAEKIMHAKMPVNILSAETGGRTSAFVVTATTEEEALEEGATLVQEMIVEHGLGLVGFGCMADKDNEMVRAAMAGGMLMAAAMKKAVMLDGVATCLVAQKAVEMAPAAIGYFFAGHVSAEAGAEEALEKLGLTAPLRLHIPDGAGEGAALCFTLFNAGIKAYKEMETFEEAGVHVEVQEFSLAEQVRRSKNKAWVRFT